MGTVIQAADVRNVDTVIIGGAIRKRRGALVGVKTAAALESISGPGGTLYGAIPATEGCDDLLIAEPSVIGRGGSCSRS